MTYFETIGVNHQYGAKNALRARMALERSCDICTRTGKHIDCRHCAIASAHHNMMLILA